MNCPVCYSNDIEYCYTDCYKCLECDYFGTSEEFDTKNCKRISKRKGKFDDEMED